MTITTEDGWIASAKQGQIPILKTASRTAVAAVPFSVFDLAGSPGAGVLAGSSTAAGVVPTDATVGCPLINAFGGGASGYLARLEFSNTVACRMALYDMLFKAGAYAFNANTTLAAQPSYSSRVPGGTDFVGTEIWLEAVTAFTGSQTIVVTYTNQAGTTGRTTGTIATGVAPIAGRMLRLPLQAGDSGVQKIESVVSSVSTVGTFNVLVLRHIGGARIRAVNDSVVQDRFFVNQRDMYADGAYILVVQPDSTATGIPEAYFDINNG